MTESRPATPEEMREGIAFWWVFRAGGCPFEMPVYAPRPTWTPAYLPCSLPPGPDPIEGTVFDRRGAERAREAASRTGYAEQVSACPIDSGGQPQSRQPSSELAASVPTPRSDSIGRSAAWGTK